MPPEKPSPGVVTGARRQGLRSGQNEIAGGNSRYNHIAQELRRADRKRAFIARRRNVPLVSVLPPWGPR